MHPISTSSILGIVTACTCAAILSYHISKKTHRNKQQLFIQAAESGFTRLCHALIYLGAVDVNRKDSNGKTPVDNAIIHNNTDLLKLLIKQEAHINKKNISGTILQSITNDTLTPLTPLEFAVILLRDDCVSILVESGANGIPSELGVDLPTLTFSRAWERSLKRDENINTQICALKIFRVLITNSASLHTTNNDYSLINTIIEHNAIQFFKVLMNHKNINVNIPDQRGNFPLHQVAMLSDQSFQNNGINYIPLLLQHNANIHALNHQGQTALHLAISHKNWFTAAHLVLHGCDLDIRDQDGHTARDLLTETSGIGYYIGLRRLVNFQEFIHLFRSDYGYEKVVKAYSKTHSLSIPNDITHLEPNALKKAHSLLCLFFPETLVSVGNNACKACNSLALLVIPDHLLPYIQENSTRIGIPANTNVLPYTQWKTRLSKALGTNPRLSRQPLLDIHRMTVRIREHGVDFDATGISLRFLTQFLHKPVSELFNRFPHTLSHKGPIHDTPFYKKLFEVARFINGSPTLSCWSESQHLHVIHVLQLMQTAKPPWSKAKTTTSSQHHLFHRLHDKKNPSSTPSG